MREHDTEVAQSLRLNAKNPIEPGDYPPLGRLRWRSPTPTWAECNMQFQQMFFAVLMIVVTGFCQVYVTAADGTGLAFFLLFLLFYGVLGRLAENVTFKTRFKIHTLLLASLAYLALTFNSPTVAGLFSLVLWVHQFLLFRRFTVELASTLPLTPDEAVEFRRSHRLPTHIPPGSAVAGFCTAVKDYFLYGENTPEQLPGIARPSLMTAQRRRDLFLFSMLAVTPLIPNAISMANEFGMPIPSYEEFHIWPFAILAAMLLPVTTFCVFAITLFFVGHSLFARVDGIYRSPDWSRTFDVICNELQTITE